MPLLTTDIELFQFLYNWVNKILNNEMEMDIIIIQSHQNAPSPDFPYMVINYAPMRSRIGRSYQTDQDSNGDLDSIQDYEYLINIYEVGGTGSNLQILIDSVERDDIKDLFFINQVSFLNNEQIQILPRLDSNDWIKEAVVEIRLGIATKTEFNLPWIETVEYTADLNN